MHYLNLYSNFLLEIHKFNYYNITHVFDDFNVIPYLKSFNKFLGFYINTNNAWCKT